jgi:hypothetical protein
MIDSVVFKAGFNEGYEDLLSDMKQWLLRSGGELKLFTLVNFQEDREELARHRIEARPGSV